MKGSGPPSARQQGAGAANKLRPDARRCANPVSVRSGAACNFVEIAIELMDVAQSDTDLEPEVTEQDDEPEIDDEPDLDYHGGGNVEDEGELENGIVHSGYGIDQSTGPLSIHTH